MNTRMGMRLIIIALLAGVLSSGCAHKGTKQDKKAAGKEITSEKQPAEESAKSKDKNSDDKLIADPGPFDKLCDRVQTQMRKAGATDDDLDALRGYCGKAGRIYKKSGEDASDTIKAIEEECEAESDDAVRLDCYNIRILEASTHN